MIRNLYTFFLIGLVILLQSCGGDVANEEICTHGLTGIPRNLNQIDKIYYLGEGFKFNLLDENTSIYYPINHLRKRRDTIENIRGNVLISGDSFSLKEISIFDGGKLLLKKEVNPSEFKQGYLYSPLNYKIKNNLTGLLVELKFNKSIDIEENRPDDFIIINNLCLSFTEPFF